MENAIKEIDDRIQSSNIGFVDKGLPDGSAGISLNILWDARDCQPQCTKKLRAYVGNVYKRGKIKKYKIIIKLQFQELHPLRRGESVICVLCIGTIHIKSLKLFKEICYLS